MPLPKEDHGNSSPSTVVEEEGDAGTDIFSPQQPPEHSLSLHKTVVLSQLLQLFSHRRLGPQIPGADV